VNYRQLFEAKCPPQTSNRRERVKKIKESSKTMLIPTVSGKGHEEGGRGQGVACTAAVKHPSGDKDAARYT